MSLKPDHLIYAAPDLEAAIDTIESLLGIRAAFGGQHLGKGSHNALLSLDNGIYLEIIAKDPMQPEPPQPRSFGLNQLNEAKLVTWAAQTADIEQTIQQSRQAGYDPGEIIDRNRTQPDGRLLRWRSATRPEALNGQRPVGDWLLPFLIDWGNTPHPADSSPSGCRLIALRATHPEPVSVQQWLRALGVDLTVEESNTAALIAAIESPNGRVELQ